MIENASRLVAVSASNGRDELGLHLESSCFTLTSPAALAAVNLLGGIRFCGSSGLEEPKQKLFTLSNNRSQGRGVMTMPGYDHGALMAAA